MKQLSCHGISSGIAIGKIVKLQSTQSTISCVTSRTVSDEMQRFEIALRRSLEELNELQNKACAQTNDETSQIFEIHKMMLKDEDFCSGVRDRIRAEFVSCEYAIQQTGKQFESLFSAMEDPYMKARSADVRDVTDLLLRSLNQSIDTESLPDSHCIIVAEELTPSQTIRLDRKRVVAFITEKETKNSHAAILARTMGIPAVSGVDVKKYFPQSGVEAIVDADKEIIFWDIDDQERARYVNELQEQKSKHSLVQHSVQSPIYTKEGRQLRLYANVGDSVEVTNALQNGARGVGLFRSEFLFLGRENAPNEEEQFLQYRVAAEQMSGGLVIIRTLDLGADKQADCFNLPTEPNPALGYRAIRICLAQKEIFKTQLRAIYRASAFGKVAIMFPMITSVWQVQECKKILAEVQSELRNEGKLFSDNVEVGIMIETPAAALISDDLAQEVNFFSIGTNDLTQYTLATDRQNPNLDAYYETHHKAILHLIEMTVQNAHRCGIWVGVCGELAADLEMTKWFYELGVDELSVAPPAIPRLYQKLYEMSSTSCP